MKNFRTLIEHYKIDINELPDKARKLINLYNMNVREIEKIENLVERKSPKYYNRHTGGTTKAYSEDMPLAVERAEDYNERIVDEIVLFLEAKEPEVEKQEIKKPELKEQGSGATLPIKEPIKQDTDKEESGGFFSFLLG